MNLVGCNTKNLTYRLWNPDRRYEITNSAETSFRDKNARDVGRPKAGHDPFPDPSTAFVPGVESSIEEKINTTARICRKGGDANGVTETAAQKQQAARYIARQ